MQEQSSPAPARSSIVAVLIGNALEWFDCVAYGYFALTLSKLFFPVHNQTTSLLLTVATFGVGFVMRPLGAIVLGQIGDTRGRRAAILHRSPHDARDRHDWVCPTYSTAGLWAPVILVLARLIQGFSAGGEMGGSTAFLIEQAPPHRRGYYASWIQASISATLLFGSLFAAALTGLLSPQALESWGWRVPFLFGLLIGPVGWYMRIRMRESVAFEQTRTIQAGSPIGGVLSKHRPALFVGGGITLSWTVCTYFFLVYMPIYATRTLGIPQSSSFLSNSAGLLVLIAVAPLFGALSDRLGRPRLMIAFAVGLTLFSYPALFLLATHPSRSALLLVQISFALLLRLWGAGTRGTGRTLPSRHPLHRHLAFLQLHRGHLRRLCALDRHLAHRTHPQYDLARLVRLRRHSHQRRLHARRYTCQVLVIHFGPMADGIKRVCTAKSR